jgi:putative oxidoreductase
MKSIIVRLARTDNSTMGLVIRITLGLVMFPHGAQKLFGWFGGFGFSATMNFMTQSGLPWLVALLVVLGESLGALALILGFFGRFMSFGILLIMLGAIFMVHLPYGFFMNWFGKASGEGFEYHILATGLALGTLIGGSGRFSIDRLIHGWTASAKS